MVGKSLGSLIRGLRVSINGASVYLSLIIGYNKPNFLDTVLTSGFNACLNVFFTRYILILSKI